MSGISTMKQLTLATAGFERYAKTTRRATFLAEMEQVVPWRRLCRLIEPVYPKAGNGRPPVGLERMLRIYFLQHWFNLSDPAVEEALYNSLSMRRFVGIDLGCEPAPDETTMCRFRHLLEARASWALGCSRRFIAISRQAGSRWPRAPSSMRRSSARRRQPRTPTRRAIRTCIRPRRAISGTSA